MGDRERNAKDRVRAKLLLVGRAVELDHSLVDFDLVHGIHANQLVGQDFIHVCNRFQHAFAEEMRLIVVAELARFVLTGAGAAGHGGGADRVVVERDIDFNGRVAAAIEDLPSVDINDHAHGELPFLSVEYVRWVNELVILGFMARLSSGGAMAGNRVGW